MAVDTTLTQVQREREHAARDDDRCGRRERTKRRQSGERWWRHCGGGDGDGDGGGGDGDDDVDDDDDGGGDGADFGVGQGKP